MRLAWQFAWFGVANAGGYLLLALGILLIHRAAGVLNFAQLAFGVAAGYAYAQASAHLGTPVVVSLLLGCAAGAAVAVACEVGVFDRLTGATPERALTASIVLATIVLGVLGYLFHDQAVTGIPSVLPTRSVHLPFGAALPLPGLAIALVSLGAAGGLHFALVRTTWGAALRAVSDNPRSALLAGVPARRVARSAWAVGGALAALAVILALGTAAPLTPLYGQDLLAPAVVAAVIAGLGSIPRCVVAAFGVGVVEQVVVAAPSPFSGLSHLVAFVAAAVVLMAAGDRILGPARQGARA